MKWEIMPEDWTPPPKCGKTRGPRSKTKCELPPDHLQPDASYHDELHLGRSPSGRWFSWYDKPLIIGQPGQKLLRAIKEGV